MHFSVPAIRQSLDYMLHLEHSKKTCNPVPPSGWTYLGLDAIGKRHR